MEEFINNTPQKLLELIEDEGCVSMPIIKCVSVSTENETVRLLIGGKCPSCGSNHLRSTCNTRFCEDVMLPVLQKRFMGQVKEVVAVLTSDADFAEVCDRVGMIPSYPTSSNMQGDESLTMTPVTAAVDACVGADSEKNESVTDNLLASNGKKEFLPQNYSIAHEECKIIDELLAYENEDVITYVDYIYDSTAL